MSDGTQRAAAPTTTKAPSPWSSSPLPPSLSSRRATLRLCWELVGARRARGVVPLAELASPLVMDALGRLARADVGRAVRVVVVVELPDAAEAAQIADLAGAFVDAAHALGDLGVALDLWPQLPDGDRFLNTRTARRFHERLLPLGHAVAAAPQPSLAPGLFLDVEPTLATLEGAWSLGPGVPLGARVRGLSRLLGGVAGAAWDARQGRRDLRELARDLAALPLAVIAAVPPPVLPPSLLLGAVSSSAAQHWLLGCPVDDDDGEPLFPRTAALCYAPLLSRVGADRDAQHRALALWAARHRDVADAICLGPLSTGLLGDEPTYAAVAHLRHDLAAVRALGYDDVTLYSLEGLLFGPRGDPLDGARPDLDEWLAALSPAADVVPPPPA